MNKHILLTLPFIISSAIVVFAQSTTAPVPTLYDSKAPTKATTTTSPGAVTSNATGTNKTQLIILAQVSLFDAKIKKLGLVNYAFSFTLQSNDLIDQEAYYRVSLKDASGKVVFLQSYPRKLVVQAGAALPVSDLLIVPQDFKGTFLVSVQVTTGEGLPLATTNFGEITLTGGKSTTGIKSCSLEGGTQKTMRDSINGSCPVTGTLTKNTFLYSNVYSGNAAAPVFQVKSAIVNGKATFEIPPRTNPGMYQIVSQLYDAGIPMSSPVFTPFVVTGQSAKIITIRTDKGVYKKDEIAKISVMLKAFNLTAPDVVIGAKLENQNKELCGEVRAQSVKFITAFTLDIPMTMKCSLPSVTVTVTDKSGTILDTYTSTVVSDGKSKSNLFSGMSPLYAGVAGIIIVLAAIGGFIIRRNKAKALSV